MELIFFICQQLCSCLKKVNLMLDFNIQLMMVNSSTLLFNMLFLVLYLTLGSLLSVLNALVWTNKSDNNMMVGI